MILLITLGLFPFVTNLMFRIFISFSTHIQNQFNTQIKYFECDNGGEFLNNKLFSFFSNKGILPRFSYPYTCPQNRHAEHFIRTLTNMVWSLLFQAHLQSSHWVEALHVATLLINILPVIVGDKQANLWMWSWFTFSVINILFVLWQLHCHAISI